jgi:hypothetical protein
LILLIDQPETWVCMGIAVIVTLVGIAALILARQAKASKAA